MPAGVRKDSSRATFAGPIWETVTGTLSSAYWGNSVGLLLNLGAATVLDTSSSGGVGGVTGGTTGGVSVAACTLRHTTRNEW